MGGLSKSQIDKLGERIRDAAQISSDDLALLQEVRAAYDDAMREVADRLAAELKVQPVSRLKTVGTIVDKLRRERMRLTQMQDIAGVRIVVDMDRVDQDALVERLRSLFDDAKVVDRRVTPSYGYRAVHVIVPQGERLVEVQVRTELQHLWAQTVEALADRFGRGLRYGEMPEPLPGSVARDVGDLPLISEVFAYIEETESSLRSLVDGWVARSDGEQHPLLAQLALVVRAMRDGFRDGVHRYLARMGQSSS